MPPLSDLRTYALGNSGREHELQSFVLEGTTSSERQIHCKVELWQIHADVPRMATRPETDFALEGYRR